MFLMRMKDPGMSLRVTGRVPKPIDPQRQSELGQRVMAGDDSAINEVIEGNVRLALSVAAKYAAFYPNLKDEYIATCFEALVDAVRGAKSWDNPTSYFLTRMHGRCTDLLQDMGPVKMPRKRNFETEDDFERVISAMQGAFGYSGLETMDEGVTCEHAIDTDDESKRKLREVKEILRQCLKTPREHLVVNLSEEGYSDCEIAAYVKVSRRVVWKTKKELLAKFRAALTAHGWFSEQSASDSSSESPSSTDKETCVSKSMEPTDVK